MLLPPFLDLSLIGGGVFDAMRRERCERMLCGIAAILAPATARDPARKVQREYAQPARGEIERGGGQRGHDTAGSLAAACTAASACCWNCVRASFAPSANSTSGDQAVMLSFS